MLYCTIIFVFVWVKKKMLNLKYVIENGFLRVSKRTIKLRITFKNVLRHSIYPYHLTQKNYNNYSVSSVFYWILKCKYLRLLHR